MNELLKTKYYDLIKENDFKKYEQVGKVLALIEDGLIKSENKISNEELIKLVEPIKDIENVYEALINDINNDLIRG